VRSHVLESHSFGVMNPEERHRASLHGSMCWDLPDQVVEIKRRFSRIQFVMLHQGCPGVYNAFVRERLCRSRLRRRSSMNERQNGEVHHLVRSIDKVQEGFTASVRFE
jgi:hypothetical protein